MTEIPENVTYNYVPSGYLMDINGLGTVDIKTKEQQRNITIYSDKELFLFEAENIVIAKYPKGEELEKSIIVHPRYATKDFELAEVKGNTNGRTLDILVPYIYHNSQSFRIINIKGTGAWADNKPMVIDPDNWYLGDGKWKPFHEVEGSLGRRWGLLDSYSGEKEFMNNIFQEYGIAQVPHISLNHMPEGILPFKGLTQLVRGLNTNIRCNDIMMMSGTIQKEYVHPEEFSQNDVKIFTMQRELFRRHKALSMIGKMGYNRYMDGKITDMENYSITRSNDEEKLADNIRKVCMGLITSAMMAMHNHDEGRKQYLDQLEKGTGIKASDYIRYHPLMFILDVIESASKTFDEELREEKRRFKYNFTKDLKGYLGLKS